MTKMNDPASLTSVNKKELFDKTPAGVNSNRDIARWIDYRKQYHLAEDEGIVSDFPLQIDFETDSRCNMKCGFCIHGEGVRKKSKLKMELFEKAINEAAGRGLCSIKMNGNNEPLMDDRLFRAIDYASKKGILNI